MSACPLLQPFQLYLEMSVVFGLSICTATTKNCTVSIGNFVLGINFSFGGGGVDREQEY